MGIRSSGAVMAAGVMLLIGGCGEDREKSVDVSAMAALESRVAAGEFPKLSSMLISVEGNTAYEKYFGEGSAELLNDTRSVSKSITALAVGCAVKDGKIADANVKVVPYLSDLQPIANLDDAKKNMTLADLLMMSSPLAADDSDQSSPGNEDEMHEQQKWAKWGIDLPTADFKRDAARRYPFHYATIQAVLAGQVVERAVKQPADQYIAASLLKPLGIERFEFQKSPSGETMTGGGLRLTSRDLLKVGQLVLDGGIANGVQVVPKAWIDECLTEHHKDTVAPGVGYGYFFWHTHIETPNNTRHSCWFMAGNGGNAVAIFPELRGVAVITRTDFNSGATARETLEILGKYVGVVLEGGKK